MTDVIKAIETRYKGYRFRSRREARWAVFMDHLQIPYQYEPEGFDLGETGRYLPDFLVYPNAPGAFWLEIKGRSPDLEDRRKAAALSVTTGLKAYIYFAEVEVPASADLQCMTSIDEYYPSRTQWVWMDEWGWQLSGQPGHAPAQWELDYQIKGSAYRFNPNGSGREKSSPWWWTECPLCGYVTLRWHGQTLWCPARSEDRNAEMDIPNFAHATPRLLAAYRAAKSARFEHGESG